MARLCVDAGRCVLCGQCLPACPAGALALTGGTLTVDESACVLCGLCVDSCPQNALSMDRQEADGPAQAGRGVWVFAQCDADGVVLPVAHELLGKGRELADARGCPLTALLMGVAVEAQAGGLIAAGADRVLLCEGAVFEEEAEPPAVEVLARLAREEQPEILLLGATVLGRSLAPRLAARLRTGLTADCTGLEIGPDGLLHQTRPAFGGNLMATIVTARHRPQMATVRPGVMQALPPDAARRGDIVRVAPPGPGGLMQLLQTQAGGPVQSIAGAKVIVSAGRGIGGQKNLQLVHRLAQLLGGAVGASRPLVDMGWCAAAHQIGQTGLSVAPDLLVCCGVSGAIQHLAGMGGAKTVVAINTDPDAPIFAVADYKLVGDAAEILKGLVAQLEAGQ